MGIKKVGSDDKWTFRLNLCEYLLYAFTRPNEIELCPQYIYHFVLSVHHQPSFFLCFKRDFCKFIANISQIRLKAHLILLDPCSKHDFYICHFGRKSLTVCLMFVVETLYEIELTQNKCI